MPYGNYMIERRRIRRSTVRRPGTILSPLGYRVANCRMTDLSEGGAGLVFPPTIDPGERFVLVDEVDGEAYECRVVWRRRGRAGVAFEPPPPLEP